MEHSIPNEKEDPDSVEVFNKKIRDTIKERNKIFSTTKKTPEIKEKVVSFQEYQKPYDACVLNPPSDRV